MACPSPKDEWAVLILSTNTFISSGSSENELSTPPSSLDKVKCFSIIDAPKEVATIPAVVPIVWSERPT